MQQQRRRPPVALSPVNNCTRSTRRSMPSTPPSQCFGCSQPMHNQFLSNVLDHLWHPECVRCFVCRCLLNEQCYSREGKLYCKDDFIKKYIHRCFACQNLVQSHELIRRVRPSRIYHAECFVCSKCKQTLQDDDIGSLFKSDDGSFNDLDCLCQTCLNPNKLSNKINGDNDITTENEIVHKINGNASPEEKKPTTTNVDIPPSVDNHVNGQQESMEVNEDKPAISLAKEHSPTPSPPMPVPTKSTGRQSKVRQSTSSNGSKRSPTKSKVTTTSRQKQTTVNERKGRSPATRSKSSATTPPAAVTVQTRSSNRRKTKNTRYRKRSFSSGSDEDETEDDDDEDEIEDEDDFPEDHLQDDGQENTRTKPSTVSGEKKPQPESVPTPTQPLSAPPPSTATNPSLLSQAKMSEPLSLLSGLAANPMSISSIMKPDGVASFMPPNFNPAFPTPPQFLPPGFSLQPRLPMPPPSQPLASSTSSSQLQSASAVDSNRSNHSANASDTDSLDRSSSPSQMDISTNVEPGTPARPVPSPKPTTTTSKPSALSSLLEFGTLPPSNLNDIRSSSASASPFPFPFVTPGPGVPFSPQAAAGMATFYRPSFGVPPTTMPLDMTQSNSSKKKSDMTDNDEKSSQNLNDDSSSASLSPKKKARKSNSRSKAKSKKNGIDGENGLDEDNTSSPPLPPPPPTTTAGKKKKKQKTDVTENGSMNDNHETKVTNGNANNPSHHLLAQMGLMNNSFMQSQLLPGASTNGTTSAANSQQAQQAQQAQLAAMYNMAPHFAAYNAFPGAFNPAFAAAAYAGGYPTPYGFHPAFSASPSGQPFAFMPPGSSPNVPPLNNASTSDDKSSSIPPSETRPAKSRNKSNTGGEKKKATTPRANKKKAAAAASAGLATDLSIPAENESVVAPPSVETTPQLANTPDSTSTPTKRRMSGTDSEDFDDQQPSQTTNGKSGYESDGSIGDGDRSLNTISSAPEKKGARTTIKPQQLDVLCKAYDTCSKPNKTQREQLVAETGLSLRVIQVWFQNKRSKERKGKPSKERDDDEPPGDDSQSSPPPPLHPSTTTSEPTSMATET